MTNKLLSDEELIDEISKIPLDTQIAIIDESMATSGYRQQLVS